MSTFKLANKYLAEEVYKSFINPNHFLVRLDQLLDWSNLSAPLWELAKNAQGGRPRHEPVLMLKMLLLSFLFDLSDRDTEELCTANLYCKYFLHLPIDEKAPDHSTLARFREEILMVQGSGFLDYFFNDLIRQAQEQGIVFGAVQALDATHTLADVNGPKDSHDQHTYGAVPRDPDAAWGVKGHETRLTKEGAKTIVQKTFFGYKAHLLAETGSGLITACEATAGNVADLDAGDRLIHRLIDERRRKEVKVLLADKGYGCPIWINLLEKYTGIMTAFSLPRTMTERGEHQDKWRRYLADPGRTAFRKERYVIERVNADLKDNHGLRRCRYLGLAKYQLQLTMAAVAHNLKTVVQLMTGARFRPI